MEGSSPASPTRPEARGGASLTYIGGNDVYLLAGGADRLPQEFDDFWLLKAAAPATGHPNAKPALGWKKLPKEEQFRGRTGHSAVHYKQQVFLYGGQSYKSNTHTSELWIYCGLTGKLWLQPTTNTPVPRNSHAACVDEAKGLMYVFGGANDQGLLADLQV